MAHHDIPEHDLSPVDLEIMRVVWSRQRVTVREVHDVLLHTKDARGERSHKPSTIATYIDRLMNRGYLGREPGEGREYEYFAVVPKKVIEERLMRKLNELCGDEGDLLHRFADTARLSVAERRELNRLAKRLKRERKS